MNTGMIVLLVVMFSLITGTITTVTVLRLVRAQRTELRQREGVVNEGIPAKATINDIRETSSSMDGRPGVLLDLTVTGENGQVFQAVTRTFIPVIHIPRFQKGHVIDVCYKTEGDKIRVEPVDAYLPG
ncbi:hypothetical protein ACHHV8_15915 [Paenibacillus sp. TAB 01]|uniref:hypothetical protein n=1 Tax=Paenibacillus sp. TAB 01 TaxID=3368988 RepID=UPI0037538916